MNGYLDNQEATDEAFAHGWFHSGGDVGWFGDDGVLWFADRYKDVIKTGGGENVASLEVERAVYAADPRVGEAVVIGLPHERWTEAITAVVVPKPGETIDPPDELRTAMREHLDGYKIPPKRSSSSTSCPRPRPARSRRTSCATGCRATTPEPVGAMVAKATIATHESPAMRRTMSWRRPGTA